MSAMHKQPGPSLGMTIKVDASTCAALFITVGCSTETISQNWAIKLMFATNYLSGDFHGQV
jgi:hypothetical protein